MGLHVRRNTSSVWNYGFEDAVVGFGSLRWAIPLQGGTAMHSLEMQCTRVEGSFGLDTAAKADNVFGSLVNSTTEDDVLLPPTPHCAEPL